MVNLTTVVNKEVSGYWADNFVDEKTGLCVICANRGYRDLDAWSSPAGNVIPAQRIYCFCPNGQTLRVSSTNGFTKKPKLKQT